MVVQNLLPALSGNRSLAEKTARRLYRNFGLKLVDLWRVESGVPVHNWVTREEEREIIRTAWRGGGGAVHHAAPGQLGARGLLLADMGIKLTVLTQPEPEDGLTDLRSASRARWGIETLIVGRDEFAFVEVIKRLQDGAALAISIDRPPERSSVLVELFGQPFRASLAAAELARASGCALIGVTIVRQRKGYAVRVLPEFVYDRRALGNQEARRELTRQIMRAFEPEIREHLDQWYHFVPIWPALAETRSGCNAAARSPACCALAALCLLARGRRRLNPAPRCLTGGSPPKPTSIPGRRIARRPARSKFSRSRWFRMARSG